MGKIVAVVECMCGVLSLSMTLPVISKNFVVVYAALQEMPDHVR
jgi:hypothetical protein